MPAKANPQTSIYEKVVEDAELEAALERREELREARSAAVARFGEADVEVRAAIAEKLELGIDAAARVGRFVITKKMRAGRSVSFEAEPKETLAISLLDEDE
jgi:hypothetical protein